MSVNKNNGIDAVLITGASDRLGLELAKECRALGYGVIIQYRSSDEPARSFFMGDGNVFFIRADLTDDASISRLMGEAAKLPVTLCGLINNAAAFETGDMRDPGHFTDIMAINALAPLKLSALFANIITEGWIINITDSRVSQMNKRYQNYRVSKLLLNEITRQTAYLYAPGIRVNAIAPGMIQPSSDEDRDDLTKSIPLNRYGDTGSIRQALRFLIGNDYVTGAVIPVDGGRHL